MLVMYATGAKACVEESQQMQSSLFVELTREMEVYVLGKPNMFQIIEELPAGP